MGCRTYLKIYLHEDNLHQDEKRYYEAYEACNWNSVEEIMQLKKLASEVSDMWNESFKMTLDPLPSCKSMEFRGEKYYAPDDCYSREEDLHYEKRNIAPDFFLVLFAPEEYRNGVYHNGKLYKGHQWKII